MIASVYIDDAGCYKRVKDEVSRNDVSDNISLVKSFFFFEFLF